jgi:hypothetical protein
MADSYVGQGYQVVVRPTLADLPAFAQSFRVELVGRRGAGGVLVSVKRNRDELAADPDVQRYAELTAAEPGWRFDLAVLEGENPAERDFRDAHELSEAEIERWLGEADQLSQSGFAGSAVITAWAALEAAMRVRMRAAGAPAGRGARPREMMNELYSSGALTGPELRRLESLTRTRNQLVHGFTPHAPDQGAIMFLSELARRLLRESQPALQPA